MLSVSRTELARRTRQVLERVRRESVVIVESYGEEQVAIVDAIDYRLLRALAAFQSSAKSDVPAEPRNAADLNKITERPGGDKQVVWDAVLAAYLAGDVSMGRAAELLELSRFELQTLPS